MLFDELIADCRKMRDTKGPEYAGMKDRLANFKDQSKDFGVTPLVVAGIFKTKHDQAIASFVRGEYRGSEPIRGRIVDAITYNCLLYGLIREAEGKNCSSCGGDGKLHVEGREREVCPACKGVGKVNKSV